MLKNLNIYIQRVYQFISILFFLIINFSAFSQPKISPEIILHFEKKTEIHKSKKINLKSENQIQFAAKTLHAFYKLFISSQDQNRCKFYPSCSEYAIISVQKYGFFSGLIKSFDRLSRCNKQQFPKYEIQKNSGLYIDFP